MKVNNQHYDSIWYNEQEHAVTIIDQTQLPYAFVTKNLKTLNDFCQAIITMEVRGAPLIGITAAWGIAEYMKVDNSTEALQNTCQQLLATRPTAVNLQWAIEQMQQALTALPAEQRAAEAKKLAQQLTQEDKAIGSAIGDNGLTLIKQCYDNQTEKRPVNILTHCNAGWLATVDWGTALAPIYKAHDAGIPVHVWVDETRPRNQGYLTLWELQNHGVPCTLITDNTGGHLMQHQLVDMCIVGTDRTTANGDVCNKIGTYLKALAAVDNNVPFYVALPTSTIDWTIKDGVKEVPIEQRDPSEILQIAGMSDNNQLTHIHVAPKNTQVANYAFDVTPAKLVTRFITEHGVFLATAEGMQQIKNHLPNK